MSSANFVDYYAVLGVPRDATADHIRSEWRKQQPRHHPDSYKLWQINAAADVLLDAAKRAEFDESLRTEEQRNPPKTPARGPASLDFSPTGPGESPTPAATPGGEATPAGAGASGSGTAPVVPPRKTTGSGDLYEARSSRSVAVPILIVIAIAGVVTFAMTDRDEPVKPSAKPTSPTPPAQKPSQTYPPSPAVRPPPPPSPKPVPQVPQTPRTSAVPADFLPVFQEYTKRSGGKAIALALDPDGRWAYGSVSGFTAQSEANEDAMSECAKHKAQSGIKQTCRLFATGDKVVW